MNDWLKEMQDKHIFDRLHFWAYKFSGRGDYEDAASDTMSDAMKEIEQLTKACHEWAEVSQQNYQRAKAAQAAMEEHKYGALEAIKLVGQSARNAGLWQGKAEGLAMILTDCVNDLERAINGKVHKESMEKLIDHARQVVENLNK